MRSKLFIGTAAILSLVTLAACEDQNTASNRDTNDRVATTQPSSPPGDQNAVVDPTAKDAGGVAANPPGELTADTREYVQKAAMGDMFEVEASRVALMRAQSAEVKKFAQDMVDAHTRTSDDLKARLVRAGLIVELPTMLDAEHQRKLDDLKAANGPAFDRLYVTQQKEAHEQALMVHRDYAMNGSVADLKALAADTVPKIEMHVKTASELQSSTRTG
jgi:putative membrane protein